MLQTEEIFKVKSQNELLRFSLQIVLICLGASQGFSYSYVWKVTFEM